MLRQYTYFLEEQAMFIKKYSKIAIIALLLCVSQANAGSTYRVKAGDTLSGIARQFNMSTKDLMEINNIKSENTINVGDVILIRDTVAVRYAGNTIPYTIQSGDTFSSIAKKFDTTTSILTELNPNLQGDFNQLYIGQKLIVPQKNFTNQANNSPATTVNTTATTAQTSINRQYTGKNSLYSVKKGDTFTGIANYFNVKATDLAKVNNVDATYKVKIGETLYIPEMTNKPVQLANVTGKKDTDTKVTDKKSELQVDSFQHIVQRGETLLGLSRKHRVSLSTLAKINGLSTTSQLKTEQKLIIPTVK